MKFSELLQLEGKKIEVSKGEHVFRHGDPDQSFYYVESGLLKAYYTSEEGRESIKSFLLPGDAIGSMTSAFSEGNCSFSLVCLEKSLLTRVPFGVLQTHSKNDLELAHSMIEMLIHVAMKKEKREYEFLCLSAEDQFLRLVESAPELLGKVTQNDLARYLGLTPVGLSRIKKRVYNNKG